MARRYNVSFEKVTVAAAQDLFQIIGASGKMLRIIGVSVACVDGTLPTAFMLALRCRFLGATVTNGSGGSSPTPKAVDPGDAAASFTAKANNTTPASSNGTVNILREDGTHIYSPYDYVFPSPPVIGPSESFVFEVITTPTSCTLSGNVLVEEIGG